MKRFISMIVAIAMSISCLCACGEAKDTSDKPKHQVYFDITFHENLLMNKYDVNANVDDETELGKLTHGVNFTKLVDGISEGSHELNFVKDGDDSVSGTGDFTVDGDCTVKCTIKTKGSEIQVDDLVVEDGVKGASITMPDVTGMALPDAKEKLSSAGLANVNAQAEGNDTIIDESNWVVTKQNVEKDKTIDKNENIVLTCIKKESYLSNSFNGLTVDEAEKLAKDKGYSKFMFADADGNDITGRIESSNSKDKIKTIGAADISDDEKKIAIYVQTNDNTESEQTNDDTESVTESGESDESDDSNESADSGEYAYVDKGQSYWIYWIIDMDKGYVYYFTDGNGEESCEKVKIDSGDMNNGLYVTFHDGGDSWQYIFHFKYVDHPDRMIMVDNDGFEYEYSRTDLSDAKSIMKNYTITKM